jgi:methylase of polypeptide subunit release factors
VLSLHAAADLLTAAATIEHLAPLARVIGGSGAPLPLTGEARTALGLSDTRDARIVAASGSLRILLVEWPRGTALRERIAAAAVRLSARAPHLLWLVIGVERAGSAVALATWTADRARPRIAALTVDRRHVVPSDAETLCALATASDGDDVMTHTRWVEVLGRDALTRRFYRALEGVVTNLADGATTRASVGDRREIALLWLSRLLFLSFLETKGWLDGDRRFLARHFEASAGRAGGAHRRLLLPLFFGTLNTPVHKRAAAARDFGTIPFLNGGLFARSPLERRHRGLHFADDALGRVFDDLLTRYRFTAREDDVQWSDAAVDPEMLGKAFESLMASRPRRESGAYYTPHALVSRVTRAALLEALALPGLRRGDISAALDGATVDLTTATMLRQRALDLTILDPACGSGAFLVHALEELTRLLVRCGDDRDAVTIRRSLLTRSIFGVDINPTAVWLCELRLWLAVVIEHEEVDPLRIPPLPNLDRHIRVGDALGGAAFHDTTIVPGGARIARLRARYSRASGSRKRTLERELDRAERSHARDVLNAGIARCAATRRALLAAWRGRDLFGERYSPTSTERAEAQVLRLRSRDLRAARAVLTHGGALLFSFATHFADAAARGGFDAIIGNPPWVRLHRIPVDARRRLRATFAVFTRAAWQHGAEAAHAGHGFAAQVDLAALFVERSLDLLRDGAPLALLLPAKLWRALAGGGVRRLLAERATVVALEDWSEYPATFDAATYPSLLVARCGRASPARDVTMAIRRRDGTLEWTHRRAALGLDPDDAAPWLMLPPPARETFDRLRGAGTALHQTPLGRPLLGVKCGCNEAFIVRVGDAPIEEAMLRPVIRGESLAPWRVADSGEAIIWTHGENGHVLPVLPPRARRWLERWRPRLAARSDARGSCWWSLFRTAAADCRRPRVLWADVGKAPRAIVLPAGDRAVPLNSCYVIACDREEDAHALATLLNSVVAAAWLNALAEPARGGYRRYLGWTVALLPVPRDWERARTLLAPLGMRASFGGELGQSEALDAVARAYRLRPADLEPLLAWMGR